MRVQGIMWAVLVATTVSGSNAFAQGAGAPAASPPPAEIAAAPADLWKGGPEFMPFVGMNSVAGDAGKAYGVGFRFGALVGARFAQNWSVGGELVLDVLSPNSLPGLEISGWNGDVAVAPLYHYPLAKVELVAGPSVGTFFQLQHVKTTGTTQSQMAWSYGWTIGANAGAFVPLHNRKALGVLLNFILHEPVKSCFDAGRGEMCATSGLPSMKMLGLSLAALL